MKKLIAILSITAIACGAYAQGKVGFANGPARLITYTTEAAGLLPADAAKGGTLIPNDGTFKAQLWYNTAAGSGLAVAEDALVAYNSVFSLVGNPGYLPGTSLTLGGSGLAPVAVAASAYGSFQVRVWSGASTTWADALLAKDTYLGKTAVFTVTAGSFSPTQLYQSPSTWPAGPLYVAVVPEPSTLALAGLGIAGLLIFRRRK